MSFEEAPVVNSAFIKTLAVSENGHNPGLFLRNFPCFPEKLVLSRWLFLIGFESIFRTLSNI